MLNYFLAFSLLDVEKNLNFDPVQYEIQKYLPLTLNFPIRWKTQNHLSVFFGYRSTENKSVAALKHFFKNNYFVDQRIRHRTQRDAAIGTAPSVSNRVRGSTCWLDDALPHTA